jgi:hypothetical protein
MKAKIMLHGARGFENRIVRAIVRDNLALHPSEDAGDKGWTITHAPTGAAVVRLRTGQAARRAMRELRVFDWSFTRMRGSAFNALRKDVRPVLRALHRADDHITRADAARDALTAR